MVEPEPPNQGKTSDSYFYHILHDPDTHFYCDSNMETLESLVVGVFTLLGLFIACFFHCITNSGGEGLSIMVLLVGTKHGLWLVVGA